MVFYVVLHTLYIRYLHWLRACGMIELETAKVSALKNPGKWRSTTMSLRVESEFEHGATIIVLYLH